MKYFCYLFHGISELFWSFGELYSLPFLQDSNFLLICPNQSQGRLEKNSVEIHPLDFRVVF